MGDLESSKITPTKAYESVTSRLFKPTQALLNAKYIPPEASYPFRYRAICNFLAKIIF